jgi:hypothetical protein
MGTIDPQRLVLTGSRKLKLALEVLPGSTRFLLAEGEEQTSEFSFPMTRRLEI